MSYIGNGRTLVILGTNVRDDIVPTYSNPLNPDGSKKQYPESGDFDQTEFELSQEVPGGYEQNALVLRQKYITDELIQNTTTVNIVVTPLPDGGVSDTFKIVCNNTTVSSTLAIVREKMKFFSGSEHKITISGSAVAKNNNTFTVVDVAYIGNGTSVEITLNKIDLQTSTTGETLTFTYSYTSPWEVLNPESDYKIVGNNKIIQFKDPPQFNDQLYVVHRGEATYNLVPSPNSVGPDQLSHNLRNFVCDRYEGSVVSGVGVKTFALSQEVVNSKAILVTVDGVVKESDYEKTVTNSGNISVVTVSGDWKLDETLNGDGKQTITFATAPDIGAKIRVLHLGFSTVSRREVLSPGQIGGLKEDAVGTSNIRDSAVTTEKIANSAITSNKLAANSVTDTKILLDNDKSLRAKKTSGVAIGLIKLDSTNVTTVEAETQASVTVNSVKKHNFTATEIAPETTNEISLGTSSKRFKDLNLSGVATVGLDATTTGTTSLNVKGDIAVNGTVDGVDVSALKALVDQLVLDLPNLVNSSVPVGTMMMWSSDTLPNSKWLTCSGAAVNTHTYKELHALISNSFGGTAYQSGVTDVVGAITTFNLPDMRRRFAAGKFGNGEIGNNETPVKAESVQYPANARTLSHTHTGTAHTHSLGAHTHIVLGHNHSVQNDSNVAGDNINRFRTNDNGSGSHSTIVDINHTHNGSSISTDKANLSITTKYAPTGISARIPDHTHGVTTRGTSARNHQHDWDTASATSLATGPNSESGVILKEPVNPRKTNGVTLGSDSLYPAISFTEPNSSQGHLHDVSVVEPKNSAGIEGHTHTLSIVGPKNVAAPFGDKKEATDTSTSPGKHKHDYIDFQGKIGRITSYTRTNTDNSASSITPANGDDDFTTTGPSTDSTGSATYGTNVSGASVSPYLTVNYIIKAL